MCRDRRHGLARILGRKELAPDGAMDGARDLLCHPRTLCPSCGLPGKGWEQESDVVRAY